MASLFVTSLAFASFTLRPQMFGYLFLILTLLLMEKFRREYPSFRRSSGTCLGSGQLRCQETVPNFMPTRDQEP